MIDQKVKNDVYWGQQISLLRARLFAAQEREQVLEYAMVAARNELGVPQPGYPAPVANAYHWLDNTLSEVAEMRAKEGK